MTGGGGRFRLLAFLLCLIAPQLYAKPKECQKSPFWTLNENNPLKNFKGNTTLLALLNSSSLVSQQQALRMEALLQDLHDYGMYDLSFIIINSKESLDDGMANRIRSRLSFPLSQEREEEQIWDVLDGDTNDMFVYDRCGRLAYFIPFPLSNLEDKETVVRAAVLSTYFRSPCGLFCNNNETFTHVDEKHIKENSKDIPVNDNLNEVQHNNGSGVLVDIEDDFAEFENEVVYENTTDYDSSDYYTIENTDLPIENSTTVEYNTTENAISSTEASPIKRSFLTSVLNFLWGNGKPKDNEIVNNTKNLTLHEINTTELNTSSTTEDKDIVTTKTDTCAEVDENVCKDWSKIKLLHTQRCCLIATQRQGSRYGTGCKNLGRKRCKKIQPILKCCLKTEMTILSKTEEPQSTI